ncbi:MAG: trypsin-like peptidase domain-containing protein [Hyphomicrobiaceae bacterium]|nr:trypsin-like peptidase domain-containing protein [Hyphomicrobiaceae bacterium]
MAISPNGYIVTAASVVEGASAVEVTLADATRLRARVVGSDKRTDIALLKVEAPGSLAAVRFADSAKVRRGQPVFAIGNPFGLAGSVSLGVISAKERSIDGRPEEYLQTDAAINRGHSGGALFNFDGEVVGMASALYSPGASSGNIGVAFAVPSVVVMHVAQQLQQSGSVERGWLGVKIQNVDADTAATLGLPSTAGALISELTAGGPAADSGLRPADVVLEVNGQTTGDSRALARTIAGQRPGDTASVVIWRDRLRKTIAVRLGRFPDEPRSTAAPADASPVDPLALHGLKTQTSDRGELVVTHVEPGSDAAAKGMKDGDVIVEAGGAVVKSPKDLAGLSRTQPVLLRVKRGNGFVFVALRLDHATPPASTKRDDLRDLDKLD